MTDTRAALASAIDEIERDILDRRGLKREWAAIDDDVRAEIKAAWSSILAAHVAAEVARALEAAPEVEEAIVNIVDEMIDVGAGRSIRIRTDAGGNPMRMVEVTDLRAAIAADRARAVAEARPTHDEARRLVDEFAEAVGDWTASGDADGVGSARAALLRAMGVES
ncbi:MAG: hypothetical protein IPJ61_20835 [Tessaracoccus sp.]|uniref:hypothetical protein n=1 Tax=Tessaracoccus sp. TaxID=1971211 RepID=UPI001EBD1475|nr:hypothetical protein [Tessaracoccus sp.]MBK7823436.1 hypothetical protein [Tessaracoccus sp.]